MEPPILFLTDCILFYLGCRGFQERGIVIGHRTGAHTRIRGLAGRVVGTVLIAAGSYFLGGSVRVALAP